MARDRGGARIRHQMLIYPVTDCSMDTPSYKEFTADGFVLSKLDMEWFWNYYIPHAKDRENPYASPVRAKDLKNLPPAHIITASHDPLRDEGEAYGELLKKAGNKVKLKRFAGVVHGFFSLQAAIDQGKTATTQACGGTESIVEIDLRRAGIASLVFAMLVACCAMGCHPSSRDVAPLPFLPAPGVPMARKIPELERYIRAEMARENIPGLAIALVHDDQVFWTAGYGVANSLTRRIVLADTPFEAASIGKPLTAYAALKLVQDGRLDLHKPLSSYLTKQFVAPSPYRDQITAWHVMTHTSGLSNHLLEVTHEIAFKPGSRFSYSGVGFMYLQRVIESITHQPFNDFMTQTVFAQLGMGSTSYFRSFGDDRIARGHIDLFGFALPMPFFPSRNLMPRTCYARRCQTSRSSRSS